jgi:transposase
VGSFTVAIEHAGQLLPLALGSPGGIRYLAGVLGETAVAAGRTQTREGARYRRLARRRGKAKAQVALGDTQLKACYALLSHHTT